MKRMTPPLCVLLTVCAGAFGQAVPTEGGAGAVPERGAGDGAVSLAERYESRELLGFGLMVSREFVAERPALLDRVLLQLEADLDEVVHLLPEAALAAVRRTTIWIELRGATNGGMSGRGMCCHWSADWLESVGLPREKAGGVEILNPDDFVIWRRTQPYMVLHELAHAYHRMIGPDLPEIVGAYEAAMEAGLYDEVARNSVEEDKTVRAYAATNHHEYFAELSEAYFALNDFAPYTRKQLAAVDPAGLAMVERLWTMSADEIAERIAAAGMMGEE